MTVQQMFNFKHLMSLFRPLNRGKNFVFGCVLVFAPTVENEEELCIRVCFCFRLLFVFHAKSGTMYYHRTELSDISYQSPYSRDSNHI